LKANGFDHEASLLTVISIIMLDGKKRNKGKTRCVTAGDRPFSLDLWQQSHYLNSVFGGQSEFPFKQSFVLIP
jgi:hypothetical protein